MSMAIASEAVEQETAPAAALRVVGARKERVSSLSKADGSFSRKETSNNGDVACPPPVIFKKSRVLEGVLEVDHDDSSLGSSSSSGVSSSEDSALGLFHEEDKLRPYKKKNDKSEGTTEGGFCSWARGKKDPILDASDGETCLDDLEPIALSPADTSGFDAPTKGGESVAELPDDDGDAADQMIRLERELEESRNLVAYHSQKRANAQAYVDELESKRAKLALVNDATVEPFDSKRRRKSKAKARVKVPHGEVIDLLDDSDDDDDNDVARTVPLESKSTSNAKLGPEVIDLLDKDSDDNDPPAAVHRASVSFGKAMGKGSPRRLRKEGRRDSDLPATPPVTPPLVQLYEIDEVIDESTGTKVLGSSAEDDRRTQPRVTSTEGLDQGQQEFVKLIEQGENVFLCGPAGFGKTEAIRFVSRMLNRKCKDYVVLTKTNPGRRNLGSQVQSATINNFLGMGIPATANDYRNPRYNGRTTRAKIRIVALLGFEEIGLFSPEELDYMFEAVMHYVENAGFDCVVQKILFGGGDLAQNMSIEPKSEYDIDARVRLLKNSKIRDKGKYLLGINECHGFAFQSVFWRKAKFKYVLLRNSYRHTDPLIKDAMADLRFAKTGTESVEKFLKIVTVPFEERDGYDPNDPFNKLEPTYIFGKNEEVDEHNNKMLKLCDGLEYPKGKYRDAKHFKAQDWTEVHPIVTPANTKETKQKLDESDWFHKAQDMRIPKDIELRKGAVVMLVRGIDDTLVTGSRGEVVRWQVYSMLEPAAGNKEVARIATDADAKHFGVTKSLDLSSACPPAVIGGKKWKVSPNKKKFPVVKFDCGRSAVITPVEFSQEILLTGTLYRKQLPLRLGWAVTSSAVQGVELQRMVYDMKNCWGKGMAYSVIGRCMSLRGLYIKNWDPKKVRCHYLVKRFYQIVEEGYRSNKTSDQIQQDMEKFTKEEAGLWWYPLLRNEELMNILRKSHGEYTDIFKKWARENGPTDEYKGWMAPHNNNWPTALGLDDPRQRRISEFASRRHE